MVRQAIFHGFGTSMAISIMVLLLLLFGAKAGPAFAEEESGGASAFSEQTITLKAKVSGANTKLTWSKADGASYYRVLRSTSKTGKKTVLKKKTTARSFTDKTAKSNKVYYYYVRAFNADGEKTKLASKKFRTVLRVYVETGHGTGDDGVWDSGVVYQGDQEAKLMIPVAKALADSLKANGIYVYTDAYNGNNRNLNYTLRFLKSHSVSAFVNVHCDSPIENAGSWALYKTDTQKDFARALNTGIHEYVNYDDRGLKKRADLKTLNDSPVPATCLIEVANIKYDNSLLKKKYKALGQGLAKGVCDYFGRAFTK